MTVYPDTFAPQVKWIPCVEKRRQSVLKDIVMYMMYYEFASRWLGTGVCPHLRRVVRTMVQHDSRKSDLSIVFHVRFSILLPLSNWRTHYVCVDILRQMLLVLPRALDPWCMVHGHMALTGLWSSLAQISTEDCLKVWEYAQTPWYWFVL